MASRHLVQWQSGIHKTEACEVAPEPAGRGSVDLGHTGIVAPAWYQAKAKARLIVATRPTLTARTSLQNS